MTEETPGQTPLRTRGVVIALNPTKEQRQLFELSARARRRVKNYLIRFDQKRIDQAIWAGCVRFAQTHGLDPKAVRQDFADPDQRKDLKAKGFSYKVEKTDYYRLTTPWIQERKRKWMQAMPAQARNGAAQDHRQANDNFVKSLMGQRKGQRVGRPQFEARFSKPRFTVQLPNQEHVTKTHIHVPKMGWVRCLEDPKKRRHGGRHTMLTIWRDVDRWYATLRVSDIPLPQIPHGRNLGSIGVDLNTGDHGVVLSTGKKFPVPKRLMELYEQTRRHQRLNRNKEGPRPGKRPSKGWVAQKKTLGKIYREMRRVRENWLHEITTGLANNYAIVVIEDLNVRGMTASAKGTLENPGKNVGAKASLNRRVLEASFSKFRTFLTYKMEQTKGTLVVVDRWFPSSQLCNRCGWRHEKITLRDRIFHCTQCRGVEDRDRNSARNLRRVYEDSISAAAEGKTGGECQPWTGRPLMNGSLIHIKSPGKLSSNGEKKRKRKEDMRQCSGGLGQLEGTHGLTTPSEVEGTIQSGPPPTHNHTDVHCEKGTEKARKTRKPSRQTPRANVNGAKPPQTEVRK